MRHFCEREMRVKGRKFHIFFAKLIVASTILREFSHFSHFLENFCSLETLVVVRSTLENIKRTKNTV